MNIPIKILLAFIYLLFFTQIVAQSHNLSIKIANQPNQEIILGSIKGDKFTPIDSTQPVNSDIHFQLPAKMQPRIYRIMLGQTRVAQIMNEPPQQLDFIYNNEDITLKTDFKHPVDSLEIAQSIENKVWYNFIKKEKALQDQLNLTQKELDYYREQNDVDNTTKSVIQYNRLQKERDELIHQTIKQHPNLYATKLIKMYQEPFLEGNLNKQERDKQFKSKYFDNLDFTDESLMNSDVYTKKVFKYLMSSAQRGLTREQQEQEFKNAIDIIISHTNENEKVYEFILDYLVSGFEKLRLDNLITYIADKYSGTTCQTDEFTTFERKLLQQKMKIGSVVPDFTLNDINGDPVVLQEVLKDKNLILFWASWCPHCNEMIPQILNWQKSLNTTDFELIAISLDDVEKDWKEKVFALGIESWYNLSSLKKWDCPVVLEYNVYATPTMFVVDRDRKIIGKPLTFVELRATLKKNFSQIERSSQY